EKCRPRVGSIMPTPSMAQPVANYMAGRTPPNPRHAASISMRAGTDQDDHARDELAIEPYYQEFPRPIGCFWHANIGLGILRRCGDGQSIGHRLSIRSNTCRPRLSQG